MTLKLIILELLFVILGKFQLESLYAEMENQIKEERQKIIEKVGLVWHDIVAHIDYSSI